MKIGIKRAYEKAQKGDGTRILVDRLWPRGVSKAEARIDIWAKDAAPSAELRKWFHADPKNRFVEFSKKYSRELKKNPAANLLKTDLAEIEQATLVTAAKNPDQSHIPALLCFLA